LGVLKILIIASNKFFYRPESFGLEKKFSEFSFKDAEANVYYYTDVEKASEEIDFTTMKEKSPLFHNIME
jgi:hypothetical protein